VEVSPGVRALGVFKDAAKLTDGCKRCGKTAIVVTQDQPRPSCRGTAPVAAPPFARRMRNHRPRPVIGSRIPLLVPRIHIMQAEVAAASLDVERGNHHAPPANGRVNVMLV
jgi:hypothetical protein